MTIKEVQDFIESKWPGTKAIVEDLTGTQDHYQVTVISELFSGKKMIDQHRLVKTLFDPHIQSGNVHALSLKTFTPAEWAQKTK